MTEPYRIYDMRKPGEAFAKEMDDEESLNLGVMSSGAVVMMFKTDDGSYRMELDPDEAENAGRALLKAAELARNIQAGKPSGEVSS